MDAPELTYPPDFLMGAKQVIEQEGGYQCDPDDKGNYTPAGVLKGTKFGISARVYPDVDIANLTEEQALAIYYRDYYLKFHFNEVPGPEISSKLLSLSVVLGPKGAVMCMQAAVRACSHYVVRQDGSIGSETISVVRLVDPKLLLVAMRSEAASSFRLIAERYPMNQKFLEGWLNRAYA